jgi:hypothetical protein
MFVTMKKPFFGDSLKSLNSSTLYNICITLIKNTKKHAKRFAIFIYNHGPNHKNGIAKKFN